MIKLDNEKLIIRFPEIADNAGVNIDFQRTLRIPEDGHQYLIPAGLGKFPLRFTEHSELGANGLPTILVPMLQCEALWLNFTSEMSNGISLPVALKVSVGQTNAITGLRLSDGLCQRPQNYLIVPEQRWLDGYNSGNDTVRQFLPSALRTGYGVDEQAGTKSQALMVLIEAFTLTRKHYENFVEEHARKATPDIAGLLKRHGHGVNRAELGFSMGTSICLEIFDDKFGVDVWDLNTRKVCLVELANSQEWVFITKEEPPQSPVSARHYREASLKWSDYFEDDRKAIECAKNLGEIQCVNV